MHAMQQRSDSRQKRCLLAKRVGRRRMQCDRGSTAGTAVPAGQEGWLETHAMRQRNNSRHKRCLLAKRIGLETPNETEERQRAQVVPAGQEGWPEMHAMRQRSDGRHKRCLLARATRTYLQVCWCIQTQTQQWQRLDTGSFWRLAWRRGQEGATERAMGPRTYLWAAGASADPAIGEAGHGSCWGLAQQRTGKAQLRGPGQS